MRRQRSGSGTQWLCCGAHRVCSDVGAPLQRGAQDEERAWGGALAPHAARHQITQLRLRGVIRGSSIERRARACAAASEGALTQFGRQSRQRGHGKRCLNGAQQPVLIAEQHGFCDAASARAERSAERGAIAAQRQPAGETVLAAATSLRQDGTQDGARGGQQAWERRAGE